MKDKLKLWKIDQIIFFFESKYEKPYSKKEKESKVENIAFY